MAKDEIRMSGSLKPTREEARKMRAERRPKEPTHVGTIESRRPTATRVIAGGILAGPIGALAGFAWRKKTKQRIEIR